jgi:molybdopterin/thiamine biosynthesis adenylyltransferase
MTGLTGAQTDRYGRHLMLEEIGESGQRAIMNGRVLIVGVGGLGSPVALYLAAAGVGVLGLVDGDRVELSNLQRQVIHTTADIGREKVVSAADSIAALNPDVTVRTYCRRVGAAELGEIMGDYDLVIDATDNFPTKYCINNVCVAARKPFVHGGVLRFAGQAMTYVPGHTCYACVFGEIPAPEVQTVCSRAGILGVVPGILGSIQAAEALKYLTGTGDLLVDRLLTFDAKTMAFRTVALTKNTACPVCGTR